MMPQPQKAQEAFLSGTDRKIRISSKIVFSIIISSSILQAPLVSFENDSDHKNFVFSGNIFLGSGKAISGKNTGSSFRTNTWFIAGKGLKFMKKDSPEEW